MILCKPNLPEGSVKAVAASGEYSYITDELKKLGITVVTTAPHTRLPYPERFHTDLQLSHYSKGKILVSSNTTMAEDNIVKKLTNISANTNVNINIKKSMSLLGNKYPYNICFNSVVIDNKLICNVKFTAKEIIKEFSKPNCKIINTKQGYSKCSTAVVNSNAVITTDESIFKVCKKNNIDVLKITPQFIRLPYYNYGFIGGCCTKLSKDILAFTGSVKNHPDYILMRSFLQNYGVYILELSNKPLLDIGGIFPLTESI